ncbi:MAG: PIN domain-containing protein, partial [Burkholderiales bacterium]
GIEAQHPDEFVSHLFDLDPGAVCAAVRDQRESLKNPPFSVSELLNEFLARELAETVAQLKSMQQLL